MISSTPLSVDISENGNLFDDREWDRLSIVMPKGAQLYELLAAAIQAACPNLTIGYFATAESNDARTVFGADRKVILLGLSYVEKDGHAARRESIRRLHEDGHSIAAVVDPEKWAEMFLTEAQLGRLKIRSYCRPVSAGVARCLCHSDPVRPTSVSTVAAILGDRLSPAAALCMTRAALHHGGLKDTEDLLRASGERIWESASDREDLIPEDHWKRLAVIIPYDDPFTAVMATAIHSVCPHLAVGVTGPGGLSRTGYGFEPGRSVILLGWSLGPNREPADEQAAVAALRRDGHRILAVVDPQALDLSKRLLTPGEIEGLVRTSFLIPRPGSSGAMICHPTFRGPTLITEVALLLGSRLGPAAVPPLMDAAMCESGLRNFISQEFRTERDRLLPPDPRTWRSLIAEFSKAQASDWVIANAQRGMIEQTRREWLRQAWSAAAYDGDGIFRIADLHAGFCDMDERVPRQLVHKDVAPVTAFAVIVPSRQDRVDIRLVQRAPGISMVDVVRAAYGPDYPNRLGKSCRYWVRDEVARLPEALTEPVVAELRIAHRSILAN